MGKSVPTANIGHEANQLCSQNVKITYNTFTTRLGSMNTLVIGGTGEGKSRYIVRPLVYSVPADPREIPCKDENGNNIPILDANGEPLRDENGKIRIKMKNPMHSFVFTDPKGELCRDTAGFLKACGYKIKVFNLVDMKYSDCYNPFKYINYNSNPNQALTVLIDGLVDASAGKDTKDPHWSNMAKAVLNSLAFYLFKEQKFEYQNFKEMARLLPEFSLAEGETTALIDEKLYACQNESLMTHPALEWRRKITAQGGELSSIISTAQASLRLWADDSVKKLTEFDTLDLDKIGDEPTAVYVITPTTNSTYDFLVATFYNQLFETLMYKANMVYHGGLPHHVLVVQDEFANTGKIPDYDKKIATFRSCNISSIIIVQSPNQIKSMYEGKAQDIVDNTHITIFLGNGGQSVGNDNASAADFVSRALGKTTVKTEGKSMSYQDQNGDKLFVNPNISTSVNVSQRDLMTPEEVRQLPADEEIVMIKGYKPFRDKKIDLDSCLNYGSDLFTDVKDNGQRKLKKQFDYSIEENKATIDNYRKGKEFCPKIDEIQAEKWAEEYIEKCHFGYIGREKTSLILGAVVYEFRDAEKWIKRNKENIVNAFKQRITTGRVCFYNENSADSILNQYNGVNSQNSDSGENSHTENEVSNNENIKSSEQEIRDEMGKMATEHMDENMTEYERIKKKQEELLNSKKEEEKKEEENKETKEQEKKNIIDFSNDVMDKNKKKLKRVSLKLTNVDKNKKHDLPDEKKSALAPNFINTTGEITDMAKLNEHTKILINGIEKDLNDGMGEKIVNAVIGNGKTKYQSSAFLGDLLGKIVSASKGDSSAKNEMEHIIKQNNEKHDDIKMNVSNLTNNKNEYKDEYITDYNNTSNSVNNG